MTGSEIVKHEDPFELGKALALSGYYTDAKKPEQAVVKVLAGREFGLGPVASMTAIHIIEGKPTMSANAMAALVKASDKYDYDVLVRETDACELEFFELGPKGGRKSLGKLRFDKADAQAAQLLNKQNWKKYPRDMMFARALTAGVRTYCPDVLRGVPAYTPEELDAEEPGAFYNTPQEVNEATAAGLADGTIPPRREWKDDKEPVEGEAVELAGSGALEELRTAYLASGWTEDQLKLKLVELGVQDVSDLREAMAGLTLDAALMLQQALSRDDSIPGSGETA